MTAAADFQLDPEDWLEPEAEPEFDETDGAYRTVAPDPFHDLSPRPALFARPSLRAELRADQRVGPITGPGRPVLPALPVRADLSPVLPDGLRRGSTLAVTSSVSLLLTLVGSASAAGAWTAMVGMPAISAEAAAEAEIELNRLAIINPPESGWNSSAWTTAVGALLDAVDIVVARPGAALAHPGAVARAAVARAGGPISDGDARRLTARARSKDAVLLLFGQSAAQWPAVEVQLRAEHARWDGIGNGYGRLRSHQLLVSAVGKGRSAHRRTTELRLPLRTGTFEQDSPAFGHSPVGLPEAG